MKNTKKFSTFCFHVCIIASICICHFALSLGNKLKWEAKLPNIQPMQMLNSSKQIMLGLPNGLGSSKFTLGNKFSISNYCQMRNKYENSYGFNSIPIFETKLNLPKVQTQIMASPNMVVRVSMNIFTLFGNG